MDTLQNMLQVASEKLGVAVDYVYTVLIQQSKVELVFDIIILVGVLAVLIAGFFIVKALRKKALEDRYSEWDVAYTVSGIFYVITWVVSIIVIIPEVVREIVQIVVNPPVWVMQFLMEMMK